ncbi:MAG: hypothetical protein CVU71_17920 [Deltaproteobacteria bacterium HGW-Deltaproteobacteria-6]|jgi:hypothetical protein|nr:MAG: hypothetical protein CVU71_17920 [Deltaproteobacteria bacterium HGW-Deltaproteobacteria-6]
MRKAILCLLTAAVLFVCSSSIAWADCDDTTYECKTKTYGPVLGYVTYGNCTYWDWGWWCGICGKDYGKAARGCNDQYPKQCKGECMACQSHYAPGCYDVNGRHK